MTEPDADCQSPAETLLRQFYAWEQRGRGWQMYPEPVRPEPAFAPFVGHYLPPLLDTDDGRRPTILSSIVERIAAFVSPAPVAPQQVPPRQGALPRPAPERPRVELIVELPKDAEPDGEVFEQFLIGMGGSLTCFEVVGSAGHIVIQFVVDEADASNIEAQLTAYFPEAGVRLNETFDSGTWDELDTERERLIVEFGLSREYMLPIKTNCDMGIDPLVSIVAVLSQLQDDDLAGMQIIFEPVTHPWTASVMRAVTAPDGSPFFDDAPEFLKQAKIKIGRPLFAVVLRIISVSDDDDRAWEIARRLTSTLGQFSDPGGNELIPLNNDDYDDEDHAADVINRQSRRSGMLLNSQELASLVHLPTADVQSSKLNRLVKKSKAAPTVTQRNGLLLGVNTHHGRSVEVPLNADQRVRHMHVIGASGTGKSTFLLNMIERDIVNGEGIGVLDPHGDLIDQILARIPESRIKDVVLVDPSDDQFPIGFNILSAHSDLEKTLLSSDLVGIFRRFSTSWGDQMGSVLGNAVLAFLESARGGTLADLRRFLLEPAFRNEFLTTVEDSQVVYYWKKEFPILSGRPQAPLLTRLDTFLRPKPIRYMVGQKANKLDIASIMDSGKILLVKLGQGSIGEENAYLLGALLVSKIHQLTLGRQAVSEKDRRHFWLYCDEFGGYVTHSMARLLSGARKYRLGLILAHQELQQIHDEDVASALITNAGTRVCFRLGDADAKTLAEGYATYEAEDLRNLGTGEAICRVGRSDDDFNLAIPRSRDIDVTIAERRRAAVIAFTREAYATTRSVVEAELNRDRSTEDEPVRQKPPVAAKSPERAQADAVPPVVPVRPQPAPAAKPKTSGPPEIAPLGKGGKQHKYLQQLLSQWAQGLGYRTTIEMPAPDGTGSIDVVLEKGSRKIACEISVTSTVEQELGNLRKCLAAGFAEVFMLCSEARVLAGLPKLAAQEFDAKALTRVRFLNVEEVFASPELLEGGNSEQTVRGYKVKVNLHGVDQAQATDRRRAVSEVLLRSIRKQE
jgi:hypothetical protein